MLNCIKYIRFKNNFYYNSTIMENVQQTNKEKQTKKKKRGENKLKLYEI